MTTPNPIKVLQNENSVHARYLLAAKSGTLDEVKEAITEGANPFAFDHMNYDALGLAVVHNPNLEVLPYLMDLGLDNYNSQHLSSSFIHGFAAKGYVDLLLKAIDRGTNVDTPDQSGGTPLAWAASTGQVATIQSLLAEGADISRCDQYGRAPIHLARDAPTVQTLVSAGAVLETPDVFGKTPLLCALKGLRLDAAHGLLLCGADANGADFDGDTPLMAAARAKEARWVRLLLDAGADPLQRNRADESFAGLCEGDPEVRASYSAWLAHQAIAEITSRRQVVNTSQA